MICLKTKKILPSLFDDDNNDVIKESSTNFGNGYLKNIYTFIYIMFKAGEFSSYSSIANKQTVEEVCFSQVFLYLSQHEELATYQPSYSTQ